MSASTSSQEPGNLTTPNFMPRPRALRPRTPRSAGSPRAARTSAAPAMRPRRPTRSASPRARWPRPRSRAPAALAPRPGPAGQGCPPSAVSTPSPSPGALEPGFKGLAGDPLVGVHVQLARAREHVVAEHDRAVSTAAELELRVGEDDPLLARVRRAELVDGD